MEFLLQPLTLLTFLPLVGVLVILFMNSESKNAIRWVALGTSLVTFVVSLWVLTQFDSSNPDLQLEAKYPWIQVAGVAMLVHLRLLLTTPVDRNILSSASVRFAAMRGASQGERIARGLFRLNVWERLGAETL